MNVTLIGMPASGKTTVSIILAEKLGYILLDTDAEIESLYGAIPEIFKSRGENYFRKLETDVIKKCCKNKNAVISTGGGAVLKSENVQAFKACGKIVYLKTEINTLIDRAKKSANRPLLAGDVSERVNCLYKARAHLYESAADYSVETDNLTPEKVAKQIIDYLKQVENRE